jgi:hypothetical protein
MQLWNFNQIPFHGFGENNRTEVPILLIINGFPFRLGSAHSQPIAVVEIPLFASAEIDFIFLITTTIKICTIGCSMQTHVYTSAQNQHALLLVDSVYLKTTARYKELV